VVESGKGVCLEGSDESEEIPADGAVPEGARPAAKDTRPATP